MLDASELSRRLAHHAESVCRHYLSNGRRDGRYWLIGDVANTPGRSLYVRLQGPETGRGAAGRWRDAATGERGDLLDLIAAVENHRSLAQSLDEARRFLSLPAVVMTAPDAPAPRGSPLAAQRLFAMSKSVTGTLAERYLRGRGITAPLAALGDARHRAERRGAGGGEIDGGEDAERQARLAPVDGSVAKRPALATAPRDAKFEPSDDGVRIGDLFPRRRLHAFAEAVRKGGGRHSRSRRALDQVTHRSQEEETRRM